jgi:hypothetical protein
MCLPMPQLYERRQGNRISWWGGLRRLTRDYEYQVESSEALIYAGMSHLLLRRLTRSPATEARSSPAA